MLRSAEWEAIDAMRQKYKLGDEDFIKVLDRHSWTYAQWQDKFRPACGRCSKPLVERSSRSGAAVKGMAILCEDLSHQLGFCEKLEFPVIMGGYG